MLCRHRERIFVEVARFVLECERSRRALQITMDWPNDLWYLWLAAKPEHLTLSRQDYVSRCDFDGIFRFIAAGGDPERYRISLVGTLYYMVFRPTARDGGHLDAAALPSEGAAELIDVAATGPAEDTWPLCIDNELFAEDGPGHCTDDGGGECGGEADVDGILSSPTANVGKT